MKVYLLVTEWVNEYDDQDCNVEVYESRAAAEAAFDKVVAEEKENDHLFDTDEPAFEENEGYFSVWEDGYYLMDHFTAQIIEKEVHS